MTKTCGQCIHLKDGSCMSLDSLVPLHDPCFSSDPACAVFPSGRQRRPGAHNSPPVRFRTWDSEPETLSNLAGDDPAVIQARAMAEKVTAENEARHARRRDWHRDIDR